MTASVIFAFEIGAIVVVKNQKIETEKNEPNDAFCKNITCCKSNE